MLSYAWADQSRVLRLRDKLRDRGAKVWMDVDHMEGDTVSAMSKAILNSSLFVPCISVTYPTRHNAMQEFKFAYNKKRKMIPVVLDDDWAKDENEGCNDLQFMMGTLLYQRCAGDEKSFVAASEYIINQIRGHSQDPSRPSSLYQTSSPVTPQLSSPQATAYLGSPPTTSFMNPQAAPHFDSPTYAPTYISPPTTTAYMNPSVTPQPSSPPPTGIYTSPQSTTSYLSQPSPTTFLSQSNGSNGPHGLADPAAEKIAVYRDAMNGSKYAQHELAAFYFYGNDVKQDYRRAVQWYQRSAEQGYSPAQLRLAKCYEEGLGVERDPGQAAYWTSRAAS
ncbi:hypothetical protein BJ742DRAFT_842594 [Cladochytrium replicatum]|nr:hypothetical protein BJ742DRAFT_842594 [Cladochytrium replicatum]